MKKAWEDALDAVELDYQGLVDLVHEYLDPTFENATALMDEIRERGGSLTVDQIRDYLLKLQLEAYYLSDIKERAQCKADLSEAKEKEKYAITFNSLDGSAAAKDKLAQASVAQEVIAEIYNNLSAALFKTKVDQLHRMVAVLTSILMSRMQETKFMNMGIADEVGAFKQKRQLLTEGE